MKEKNIQDTLNLILEKIQNLQSRIKKIESQILKIETKESIKNNSTDLYFKD